MLAIEPVVEKGEPLLDEAARRIRDPRTMERLKRLRQHHELVRLTIKGMQAAGKIDMSDKPSETMQSSLKETVERFEALLNEMKAYAPNLIPYARTTTYGLLVFLLRRSSRKLPAE